MICALHHLGNPRRSAAALALLWLVAAVPSAPPPLALYEGRTILTGTDMRSRPAGLAACLRDVLVQVSGDPALANDPRIDAPAASASAFVASIDYVDRMSGRPLHDEQGSSDRPYDLTAHFDPAKVDALLAQLDDRPWTGARPTLIALVFLQSARLSVQVTADGADVAAQRDSLKAAAERYAMPLALPDTAGSVSTIGSVGGHQFVAGHLIWSETAHGWIARFDLLSARSPSPHWEVAGVSFDEAFRVLVRGAAALASGHANALPAAAASPP